jgi:diguanylate cyclase (GGDEF)-like protein
MNQQGGGRGLVHPEDLPMVERAVKELAAGAEGAMIEYRARKRNGEYLWVESSLKALRDSKTGTSTGTLNVIRDITERKRIEQSRAFHHSLNRAIHDVSLDGILVVNNEGKVVSYNKGFSDVWRISTPDIPEGRHEEAILAPDSALLPQIVLCVSDPEGFLQRVRELYENPDANDQCEIPLKDGRTLERYSTCLRSEGGQYLGRVWFFRDISERRQAEKKLQDAYNAVEALAATDALTGLANRRRFDDTLSSEWRRGLRDNTPLSLLMIDADLFKSYNDAYGHPRGDRCLKQVAEAAQNVAARAGDLVARFGGEEFAVILPNTDSNGALRLATEICDAMRARRLPHIDNPFGVVTVSVGCATIMPAFGQHAVNLIELADEALYKAKHHGRNRVCDASPIKGVAAESGRSEPTEPTIGKIA